MSGRRVMTALLMGGVLLAIETPRAAEPPPGCAKIVAVLDQIAGLSADEVAEKMSTDVETVRNSTDLWRRTVKQ